jgi:hypothetical protein
LSDRAITLIIHEKGLLTAEKNTKIRGQNKNLIKKEKSLKNRYNLLMGSFLNLQTLSYTSLILIIIG